MKIPKEIIKTSSTTEHTTRASRGNLVSDCTCIDEATDGERDGMSEQDYEYKVQIDLPILK